MRIKELYICHGCMEVISLWPDSSTVSATSVHGPSQHLYHFPYAILVHRLDGTGPSYRGNEPATGSASVPFIPGAPFPAHLFPPTMSCPVNHRREEHQVTGVGVGLLSLRWMFSWILNHGCVKIPGVDVHGVHIFHLKKPQSLLNVGMHTRTARIHVTWKWVLM